MKAERTGGLVNIRVGKPLSQTEYSRRRGTGQDSSQHISSKISQLTQKGPKCHAVKHEHSCPWKGNEMKESRQVFIAKMFPTLAVFNVICDNVSVFGQT